MCPIHETLLTAQDHTYTMITTPLPGVRCGCTWLPTYGSQIPSDLQIGPCNSSLACWPPTFPTFVTDTVSGMWSTASTEEADGALSGTLKLFPSLVGSNSPGLKSQQNCTFVPSERTNNYVRLFSCPSRVVVSYALFSGATGRQLYLEDFFISDDPLNPSQPKFPFYFNMARMPSALSEVITLH